MQFENKWPHGSVRFEMPPLPADAMRQGCSFRDVEFDASVGREWCLLFGEEAAYAHGYAAPLDLNAIMGAVNTPHGPLGYIVWQIALGTPQEVMVEHWLNMHDARTLRLLLEAGGQTHFKLVIYDIEAGAAANMIEFENTFGLDKAASTFAQLARLSDGDDFEAKQQFAMQAFSLEHLTGKM